MSLKIVAMVCITSAYALGVPRRRDAPQTVFLFGSRTESVWQAIPDQARQTEDTHHRVLLGPPSSKGALSHAISVDHPR